ncbi:MAG: response regulator [Betaproteobacteria bacterium]|nr:response regulator [Betaproteobacteria bacterium]
MTPRNPDTCTTREAARRLGVSLRTVQLWTESGVLEAWKTPGGHRRVLQSSVERLLAERQPAARATGARRLDVLVVEDEATLLDLYRMSFETFARPPEMRHATNGYEGLIRIGERRPDVLVTDLMMPGIDGFQMLRTLCAQPDLAAMKVIVVTGLQSRDIDEQGGLPEGVTVLGKPIPFDRLEELLDAETDARGPGNGP